MKFENIYSDITNSFGKLWNVRKHGESLEIITPFVTTNDRFVSLFLSVKKNGYVISDGGWITDGTYGNKFNMEILCFSKLFLHYVDRFEVKETKGLYGNAYFYKITKDEKAIPSLVMDVANFIAAIVSAAEIEFKAEEDEAQVKRFRGLANEYLASIVPANKIDTKGYLDASNKTIRISAIIKPTVNTLILINYITGSNHHQFTSSVARTNLMFQMADATTVKPYIKHKISLVDDSSNGFIYEPNGSLDFALEHTKSKRVDWSKKENLKIYLN